MISIAIAALCGSLSACQDRLGENLLTSDNLGETSAPVVYGDDDRQDVYQFADSTFADRAREFSVALVSAALIDESDPADVQLSASTLAEAYDLCTGEAFATQLAAGRCSGTLVASDLVLTAGQCIDDATCADGSVRFVFDHYLSGAASPENIASADDIYDCNQIIDRKFTGNLDYALVQLDRPVTGRTPATVRSSSAPLADGLSLYVSGFPLGLPLKLDAGAAVRDGRPLAGDYFVSTADTFSGSSGSGLFDPATGDLVGVAVRGEADFEADGSCLRVKTCTPDGCVGEDATYAFRAFEYLCDDANCDEAFESSASCPDDCGQVCGDGVCNGTEAVTSCESDCGTCGNGACDGGETRQSCAVDCNAACSDGTCDAAIGEDTANCDVDCGSVCGDGACNGTENGTDMDGNVNCPEDCSCGDLVCEEELGESAENCCNDCGCDDGLLICVANECRSRLLVCNDPGELDVDELRVDNPVEVIASGETYNGLRVTAGTCVTGDSPERVYSFTLNRETTVEARVIGDFDTTMYLRGDCTDESPDVELACDDNANPDGNDGSAISIHLPVGTYYLYVDGRDGDSGSYTLTVNFSLECEGSGDGDGDGVCDAADVCPEDPEKIDSAGQCGCNVSDEDSDGDGLADCNDECDNDPLKSTPGLCGCGNPEGDCPTCNCEVGRGDGGSGSVPGAFILALLGLLAIRRPLRLRLRPRLSAKLVSRRLGLGLSLCSLVLLSACSSGADLTTDKSCEVVTCAENAVCVGGSARVDAGVPDVDAGDDAGVPLTTAPHCECLAGFEGDPQACVDVNECERGTHDCDGGLCVNTRPEYSCAEDGQCELIAPGFSCIVPQTCADVRDADPMARDGDYVLYVNGELGQPWAVYCHDMEQGSPREYLPLTGSGPNSNFSQYEATTDGRTGQDVLTRYSHVRIDPQNFTIDVTDRLFAESTGSVIYQQQAVEDLPFGVAMSCDRFDAGQANIDLSGTPFTLASGFCPGGFGTDGEVTVSPDNRIVDMSVVGGCGWLRADDRCADNPLADGASALQLQYQVYERRVFVTSGAVPSDFGGAAGADTLCQTFADSLESMVDPPGEFVAWLGSADGHPAERLIQHQARYVLLDGTLLAENWRDLTDGTLRRAINVTERGTPVVADPGGTLACNELTDTAVWTGTDTNGQDFGVEWTCSDWTGTGERVGVGSYARNSRGWTDACRIQVPGGDPCAGQVAHLYCFEK